MGKSLSVERGGMILFNILICVLIGFYTGLAVREVVDYIKKKGDKDG